MPTDPRPFTAIAAVFLALVALAHLLRVVYALEIVVGDFAVPLSASVIATLFAAVLSILVWRESHR